MSSVKFLPKLCVVAMAGVVSSANAACYIDSNQSTIRSYLLEGFTFPEKTMNVAMNTMDLQIGQALNQQTSVLRSALEVLAQQKQMAAQQIATAYENNTKAEVVALDEAKRAEKQLEVLDEYGHRGQGHDVCQVHENRQEVVEQQMEAQRSVPTMVRTEISARPGRYANRAEQVATRLTLHDKLYCTKDQAKSGLCAAEGPRAGKSLMAATMFEPADYNSDNYHDKSAFINNMMGVADDALTTEEAKTMQGQAYMDNKRRLDSIKSTAGTYLKTLQAYWSGVGATEHTHEHDHGEKDEKPASSEARQLQNAVADSGKQKNPEKAEGEHGSENTALSSKIKQDVDRYFGGGDEYKKWSQYLVGANERGVMQELLAVKALRLKLAADEYEQLLQQEAMLASYASAVLSSSGLEQKITQQRDRALRRSVSGIVGQ